MTAPVRRRVAIAAALVVVGALAGPVVPARAAGVARAATAGPAPNGENPAATATLVAFFPRTGGRRLLVSRSRRGVLVRGRLVDAGGGGIRSALIDVRLAVMAPWARASRPAGPRTAADGSFAVRVPSRMVSRRVRLSYRPDTGQPAEAAAAVLVLRVRAALRLRVSTANLPRGGTLRFAGRLVGGALPRLGKVVELQVRDRGGHRWLTFRTLRVRGRSGRFRARYTFRRARGPLALEFRARARADGAYPFATGASRPLRVRVR